MRMRENASIVTFNAIAKAEPFVPFFKFREKKSEKKTFSMRLLVKQLRRMDDLSRDAKERFRSPLNFTDQFQDGGLPKRKRLIAFSPRLAYRLPLGPVAPNPKRNSNELDKKPRYKEFYGTDKASTTP